MSTEICKLCDKECTPWFHINGHICQDCYESSKKNIKKVNEKFIREIKFIPILDSIDIRFYLKGEKAIIQFCISTGWNHQMTEFDEKVKSYSYDIGYHSPIPKYEGQKKMEKCKFYENCYYDGSSMYANELFDKLISYGDNYIWEKMEEFYHDNFG